MTQHIHIQVGGKTKTKDASGDPRIDAAVKNAEKSIEGSIRNCETLQRVLLDRDDKAEVGSAITYLRSALGKLNEVVG